MSAKTKVFDCVEMKHQAQQRLRAEYESRKEEYPSYYAFLEARESTSLWQRELWERIAEVKRTRGAS